MAVNPKGVIPYALFLGAIIFVSPWFLLAAAAWYVLVEFILN